MKAHKSVSQVAPVLIRISVGLIFLSEGIQKFLFPEDLGAGRFQKIGLPFPEFLGPFVGSIEITCGFLVLTGLFTRFAAIPLTIIMLVAISVTKIALIPQDGFWAIAHGARTDFSMLLSNLFLIVSGSGSASVDHFLFNYKHGISSK